MTVFSVGVWQGCRSFMQQTEALSTPCRFLGGCATCEGLLVRAIQVGTQGTPHGHRQAVAAAESASPRSAPFDPRVAMSTSQYA
jgi:hypothetical protein